MPSLAPTRSRILLLRVALALSASSAAIEQATAQMLDFRGSQTGIEDTATPLVPPNTQGAPALAAPPMQETAGAPLLLPAKAQKKRPPPLPALAPYTTYPPAQAKGLAARKVNGPAQPLPTTGLPPMTAAAGQRKPVEKFQPNPAPAPTAAALPTQPHTKPAASALGPYDPVGIDVGPLRLTPYAETDLAYDTNPTQARGTARTPSPYARFEAGTKFKSDWTRHALSGELKAGYSDYFQAQGSSHPDLTFNANGRIDVERDTELPLESHFNFTNQRNTQTIAGVTRNVTSGVYDSGVAAGITQRFGRFSTTLRGSLDRLAYQNPNLAGTMLNLASGNYNTFELRGRAAYEITPGFSPYLQASIDTRKHDIRVDTNGYARDSVGRSLRIGTTYELTRTLTADANIGIATRDYVDPRFRPATRPVADLSLIWQATPLTTVTLKGSATQDETTLAGASSVHDTKLSLQVDHDLLRNLRLTGTASFQNNKFLCGCRSDHIETAGLSANYSLTRELVLRGAYTYTHQGSTDLNSRYNDHVFLLGLRVQR